MPSAEAPILEAFCANVRRPDAQQATWAAAAAYLVWELPHALEVAEVAQVVTAACDTVAAAIKVPRGGAPTEAAGADTAPWGAAAWGLLVLEGAARVAWGVPLSNRCAASQRTHPHAKRTHGRTSFSPRDSCSIMMTSSTRALALFIGTWCCV